MTLLTLMPLTVRPRRGQLIAHDPASMTDAADGAQIAASRGTVNHIP